MKVLSIPGRSLVKAGFTICIMIDEIGPYATYAPSSKIENIKSNCVDLRTALRALPSREEREGLALQAANYRYWKKIDDEARDNIKSPKDFEPSKKSQKDWFESLNDVERELFLKTKRSATAAKKQQRR
jgi:hypothetical protein